MKQQTAVEWFAEQDNLALIDFLEGKINEIELAIKKTTILQQAKEKEKEQIVNSWDLSRRDIDYPANGEQYYNETFKNK